MKELPEYAIARGEHAGIRWPTGLPERTCTFLRGHTNTLQAVCAVPVGNQTAVASASTHGTVRLWDPATGLARGEPLTGHDGTVSAFAAAAMRHRRLLASGGMDGPSASGDPTIATATGDPVETGDGFAMCGVPIDRRQVLLAVGDDEGTTRLWAPPSQE